MESNGLFGHSRIDSPSPSPHPPEITIVNSIQGQNRTTSELCKPFPLFYLSSIRQKNQSDKIGAAEPVLDTIPPATPGEGSPWRGRGRGSMADEHYPPKPGAPARPTSPRPAIGTCWAGNAGQDPAGAAAAIAAPVCPCKMTSSENVISWCTGVYIYIYKYIFKYVYFIYYGACVRKRTFKALIVTSTRDWDIPA